MKLGGRGLDSLSLGVGRTVGVGDGLAVGEMGTEVVGVVRGVTEI
jgi:hypothetical protein